MHGWQLEVLENVKAAATPQACFAQIATQAAALGFEFCTHGMRLPLPVTKPRTTMQSNYPAEWLQRYNDRGYMEIDPTVAHGMRSSAPVVWSDALFKNVPDLWREAQGYGLRHGWAQSRRDPEGTYSMLVLVRSEGELTAAELERLSPYMQWLTHASHDAMKASGNEALREPGIDLSEREIDVLRWTAEGKTAADVADILKISERTVNFHINTAVEKLGACNKTSAAVRAAMLGLLW